MLTNQLGARYKNIHHFLSLATLISSANMLDHISHDVGFFLQKKNGHKVKKRINEFFQ